MIVLTSNISQLLRNRTLFLDDFLKNYMISQKTQNFGCDALRFRQNFCSDFSRKMKSCVLLIFGTLYKKHVVKDQNYSTGNCCFSMSENILTIHLTYRETDL